MVMISRFNSKTEMPVPSKATLDGSFCDLKRKKTEEDMMLSYLIQIYKRALCSDGNVREKEFPESVCCSWKPSAKYLDWGRNGDDPVNKRKYVDGQMWSLMV